jgi:hypothetical protein
VVADHSLQVGAVEVGAVELGKAGNFILDILLGANNQSDFLVGRKLGQVLVELIVLLDDLARILLDFLTAGVLVRELTVKDFGVVANGRLDQEILVEDRLVILARARTDLGGEHAGDHECQGLQRLTHTVLP